jgi:peroxiredoxin
MGEHGLEMAVLADEDGALARRYGVRGVPTLFVLDGAGRIRFTELGYTTEAGLRLGLWWAARGWR